MPRTAMPQLFALPVGAGLAMKGAGAATRTAQAIGIEWLDYAKASYDALSATLERLAAARTPVEVWTIQGAFLRGAGDRFAARSAIFADLFAALAADLARPSAAVRQPPGP